MCTAASIDDARAFLPSATKGMEGTERRLNEGLERSGLCMALRNRSTALQKCPLT